MLPMRSDKGAVEREDNAGFKLTKERSTRNRAARAFFTAALQWADGFNEHFNKIPRSLTEHLFFAGGLLQHALEIENLVNLTDIRVNTELVMTLETDIRNVDGTIFTDSNCLHVS